ncbi:U20-hexatoxin-Hi1a-like [Stigmatopora nigra]
MKLLTTLVLGLVIGLVASLPLADVPGGERPKSHCELHRDGIQTTSPEGFPIVGAFIPKCEANGDYTPRQCHGSSGHCWCVNEHGQEKPGTRTPPSAGHIECI